MKLQDKSLCTVEYEIARGLNASALWNNMYRVGARSASGESMSSIYLATLYWQHVSTGMLQQTRSGLRR